MRGSVQTGASRATVWSLPLATYSGTRSCLSVAMASDAAQGNGGHTPAPSVQEHAAAAAAAAVAGKTAGVDAVLQGLANGNGDARAAAARDTVLAAALIAAAGAGKAATALHICSLHRTDAGVGASGSAAPIAGLHDAILAATRGGFTTLAASLHAAADTRTAIATAGVDVNEGGWRGVEVGGVWL